MTADVHRMARFIERVLLPADVIENVRWLPQSAANMLGKCRLKLHLYGTPTLMKKKNPVQYKYTANINLCPISRPFVSPPRGSLSAKHLSKEHVMHTCAYRLTHRLILL